MFAQPGLPAQTTSLIGREHEVETLRRLLLADNVRLLTLTGPGGIGKTRLAIHIAALLADNFDDGVQFVPLAHITDPSIVLIAIAHELGLQTEGTTPLRDSLFSFLRRRRMLIVLDNFEQIVDAAVEVAALLAECPCLTLLITSRIVLHLRGEHEFPVPPLALPDAAADALALPQYAAVLLFIQRATAVRPDFRLTNANAPAVAEICARLDGLPLAIELAAARVKILTPQAMLPRLNNRLQLLRGGAVDLPLRQQTLRNTIAWSYELLQPHQQVLFRRLSVFQGYWNLAAAEAVCAPQEDVVEAVESLVDKSMVQQREMGGGEQYFILLETLREFAQEQLHQAGDADALAARHAQYYLDLAESHNEYLDDDSYLRWVAAITPSFDNIRNAFFWMLDHDMNGAMHLLVALAEHWYSHERTSEGMSWMGHVLPHAGAAAPHLRAELYNLNGFFHRERGNIPEAVRYHKLAVDTLPEGEDERLRNAAMGFYGISLTICGRYEEAEAVLSETLERQRADDDRAGMARTLMYYARCKEENNSHNEALALLEQSIALYREQGLTRRMISVLSLLASLHGADNSNRALPLIEEALRLCHRFGDTRNEIRSYINLASLNIVAGRYSEAGTLLLNGLALAIRLDAARAQVLLLLNCATVFYKVASFESGITTLAYTETLMQRVFPTEYKTTFSPAVARDIGLFRDAVPPAVFDSAWKKGCTLSIEQLENIIRGELDRYFSPADPDNAPAIAAEPVPAPSVQEHFGLTSREIEILRLLAGGLSNKEIGLQLFISERTVHAHVRSIYSKLNLSSRSAATRFAVENGVA